MIVFTIGIFFLPTSVALSQIQKECADPPPGQKAVLFILAANSNTDNKGKPISGTSHCINVEPADIQTLTFGHLIGGGLFLESVADDSAELEAFCPSVYDGNNFSDYDWGDVPPFNNTANDFIYDITSTKNTNVQCTLTGTGDEFKEGTYQMSIPGGVLYRHHFKVKDIVNGTTVDKYLYFVSSKSTAKSESDFGFDACQCQLADGTTQVISTVGQEKDCPAGPQIIGNGTPEGIEVDGCQWIKKDTSGIACLCGGSCYEQGKEASFTDDEGNTTKLDEIDDSCVDWGCDAKFDTLSACQTAIVSSSGSSAADLGAINTGDYKFPDDYIGPLAKTPCAADGSCRDINDLLLIFIQFGNLTLGVIGTFSFVFFVYGGFVMITSFGNSERVKRGRDILIAAIVGILISFSAYALIDFMLDALSVGDEFRGIK